jgi:hypothetical protein
MTDPEIEAQEKAGETTLFRRMLPWAIVLLVLAFIAAWAITRANHFATPP